MPGLGKKIKVKGVVLPSCWDEDGNVTDIKFYAHGEKQYEVSEGGKAAKLFKLLKQSVQIMGHLVQSESGKDAIMVRRIYKLEGEEKNENE